MAPTKPVGPGFAYKRAPCDEDGDIELEDVASGDQGVCKAAGPATPGAAANTGWMSVLLLCAVVSNICSIDRTAMSVAILPMAAQFAWRKSVMGAVSSAFNLGYTFTNAGGGFLAARFGAKRVLTWGVTAWSAFTVLTPLAANMPSSITLLLVVRAAMGVGEGVAFPSMQYLVKSWVPPAVRSRALGLIYSGHQVGSILALLISPSIIYSMGWPWVFYLFGSLGFVWVAFWQPLVASQPPLAPWLAATSALPVTDEGGAKASGAGEAARGAERAGRQVTSDINKPLLFCDIPWGRFAANRPMWALAVAHSTFGLGYNLCMSWLPTYYNQQFGVNVRQSAWLSILPWLVMAVTTNASGWIADGLMNGKHMSATHTRKLLQTLGNGLPALCLLYLSAVSRTEHAAVAIGDYRLPGEEAGAATIALPRAGGMRGSLTEALLLLTVMMGGLGFQAGGFASNHGDITTRYAGLLFGFTNALSSMSGTLGVYATGVALEGGHGWAGVFNSVAWCNLFCLFLYQTFATSEPQFD